VAEEEKTIEQASQKRGKAIPISFGERQALLSNLKQAEGMIRHDKSRETVVVFDRSGEGFFVKRQHGLTVELEDEVRRNRARFEGAILTHNHPSGTPFSNPDINLACWARLAEIRIASSDYDYSFRNRDGNMSEEWWRTEVVPFMNAARQSALVALEMEGIGGDGDEFVHQVIHRTWENLAKTTSVEYTKIDRRKRGG
jgi:hypothetical protein